MKVIALLALVALAGCATAADLGKVNATAAPQAPATAPTAPDLHATLLQDLQGAAALACAEVDGKVADPQGCACYPVLATYVQANAPQADQVQGLVSGFELARLKVNKLQSGIPVELQMACGALVMDVRMRALDLAGLLGFLRP